MHAGARLRHREALFEHDAGGRQWQVLRHVAPGRAAVDLEQVQHVARLRTARRAGQALRALRHGPVLLGLAVERTADVMDHDRHGGLTLRDEPARI